MQCHEKKFLHENESFSKTILDCESGAHEGSIHEAKHAEHCRDTATLTRCSEQEQTQLFPVSVDTAGITVFYSGPQL